MPPRSGNERLAVVESKITTIEREFSEMRGKVDEIHSVLMQAKGAKWAIVSVYLLAGFLAGIAHKIVPFMR